MAERTAATGRSRRKVAAVIRAATGNDVQVGEAELQHAARHVVVKLTGEGAFFATMYATGKSVRPSHRKFKKVSL